MFFDRKQSEDEEDEATNEGKKDDDSKINSITFTDKLHYLQFSSLRASGSGSEGSRRLLPPARNLATRAELHPHDSLTSLTV